MVKVRRDTALPACFVLRLTKDGKISRGCTVVWREFNRTGVRFFQLSGSVVNVDTEPAWA